MPPERFHPPCHPRASVWGLPQPHSWTNPVMASGAAGPVSPRDRRGAGALCPEPGTDRDRLTDSPH